MVLAMACGGGGGGGGGTVITNVAPSITTQPASQTVKAGSSATFTATASGTPAPTFTWERSNNAGTSWTAITGATSGTYSFTVAKADHTAQFRATASNSVSPNAVSTAATLTVQWLAITTQPASASVVAGDPATFTVVADASPTPTYQWQSSPNGTDWANITAATDASYATGAATVGNSGTQYRCVLTNAFGTLNSNAATLTVTAPVVPPEITSFVATQTTLTTGTSTTLTAVFSGGTGSISNGVGAVSSGVPISTGNLAANTTFTLTVTPTTGTPITQTVTVTVIAAPAITSFTAAASSITSGTGTTLTAVFSGGTASVDNGIGDLTTGTAASTGNLTATRTYTLTVTNAVGTAVSATRTVTVVAAPVITSFTATAANVTTGTGTTLTAVFTDGTGSVDNSIGAVTTAVAAATGNLTTTTTYTLTVTNAAGTAVTSTATVTVVAAPVITSFTATAANVTTGTGTTLTAVFTDGTGSVDNGVGAVTTAVAAATGNLTTTTTYTLTVSNIAGTAVTSTATVTVVAAASQPVVTAPANVTASMGNLTASVPAQTGVTYLWALSTGSITAGQGTTSIIWTAPASGSVTVTCTVSNAAGDAAAPGTATSTVVAAATQPVVTAPANVTASTAGLTASVPAQTGGTYLWALSTGTITAGQGTTSITWTAPASGSVTVTCTVSNAAGDAATPGTATSTVVAAPSISAFTASPATITSGTSSMLNFTFTGGTGSIDQAIGSVVSGSPTGTGNLTVTTTYTLTVTNAANATTTLPVTVTVVPAPTITSFTNAGLLGDGTGAMLTGVFNAGPGGTVLAEKADHTALGAITSGVALTVGETLSANTSYNLIVTNAAGLSVYASTLVRVLPVFTTMPAPQVLSVGNPATFNVVVSAPSAITNILWERSNDQGVTWSTVQTGSTSPSYTTANLATGDNGALFRARATNAAGSTTSMAAGVNTVLAVALPSALSLDLVLIPAGAFQMGETDTAPIIVNSEPHALAAHPVTFSAAFYMAKVPVTQAQWLAIMGSNPSQNTGGGGNLQRPVDNVSFDTITAATTGFLDALNAATVGTRPAGSTFRLPTDAEYEYSLRAGSTDQNNFYFGSYDSGSVDASVLATIDSYMWSVRNSGGTTQTVGLKLPNAWGLYDMIGQVWQVLADDWHVDYNVPAVGAVPVRPDNGTAWVDSPRAAQRTFRGGALDVDSHYGQSKVRGPYASSYADWNTGFRVVLQLP